MVLTLHALCGISLMPLGAAAGLALEWTLQTGVEMPMLHSNSRTLFSLSFQLLLPANRLHSHFLVPITAHLHK